MEAAKYNNTSGKEVLSYRPLIFCEVGCVFSFNNSGLFNGKKAIRLWNNALLKYDDQNTNTIVRQLFEGIRN